MYENERLPNGRVASPRRTADGSRTLSRYDDLIMSAWVFTIYVYYECLKLIFVREGGGEGVERDVVEGVGVWNQFFGIDSYIFMNECLMIM